MKKFNLKWSFGNRKVSKLDAVGFGIPPEKAKDGFITCPMAGACAAVCYDKQGMNQFPVVVAAKEFNLAATKNVFKFEVDAIDDLKRIKKSIVRVHTGGDFYSQDYLDTWFNIAREFPFKTFYAYTKSLHLDFSRQPLNFKVTQSKGGKLDSMIDYSKPHSRIFATDEARKKAGYVDGNVDDSPAIRGEINIGLVYHGTRNLTETQKGYFA